NADIRPERHFGERDGDAAIRHVVAGRDPALVDRMADEVTGALFRLQVHRRRRAFLAAVNLAQPDRLAQMAHPLADREDDVAGALEADADGLAQVVDDADAADRGGRQDRAAATGRL